MENDIKKDILTVQKFIVERPDMSSFGEPSIQSVINTITVLLDSDCGGLIARVWYEEDPLSPNYRNDWEKSQIFEAFVSQTQFTLNLGNDFTQGSESFSIGGINGSYSRPKERDVIAPGVYKLLQNARVYQLQNFGTEVSTREVDSHLDPMDRPINRNIGDQRYLRQYQPDALPGRVATISDSNTITFEELKSVPNSTNSENTNKILDRSQQLFTIYRFIDEFPISTWKGLTAQEIFALVQEVLENSGIAYRENQTYALDQKTFLPIYVGDVLERLDYYLSRIDNNLGNFPSTSPLAWNPIPDAEIPIGEVVEALKPYIDIAVEEAVDKLPSITVGTGLEITEDEVLQVDSTILTEAEAIAKFVDLVNAQVIAGVKTITQTVQETITFTQNLRLFHKNNTAGYVDFVQLYDGAGYKNWTGFRFIRRENGVDVLVAEVVMDADNNLRFNTIGDGFMFNSKRLMKVGDATADDDAPNLGQVKTMIGDSEVESDAKYATKTDLGTKQNTLIAGDNITITGDTISATGGTSIDYEIVQETFLTDGSGYIRDIIQVNQVISVGDSQGEKLILWNFVNSTWLLVYFWDNNLKIWNNFENKSVNIWLKKPIVKKEGK